MPSQAVDTISSLLRRFNSKDYRTAASPLATFKIGRRCKLFVGAIFSVIALNSCTFNPKTITLSSGFQGSGYQQIGKEISISAQKVGKINVLDNYDSQGSQQNLERLLNKEVDFAIVQLDVATEAMKQGQVKTIVILTEEYLHLITRTENNIQTFADLEGKRVAVSHLGSGIYFTAQRIFQAAQIKVQEDRSTVEEGLNKLLEGKVDAFIYVGPLAANKQLRAKLTKTSRLRFIPIDSGLVNYLTINLPETYDSATIPKASYSFLPELPRQDLPTISTRGALITRPDVNKNTVALLTWSILSTFRDYLPFYPKLAEENSQSLMYEGLLYTHPGAQQAFDTGDPRSAWIRYLQDNQPLQSALIMLLATSTLGFSLRWWHRKRYLNLIKADRKAISELRSILAQNPQQAMTNVEQLRQQHRLMLLDGTISVEVYEQIERMTQVFAEQCRNLQQRQYHQSIRNIFSSLDQWQSILEMNPQLALAKLKESQDKYQKMLLSGQINIQTYIQLEQLNLILAMFYASVHATRRSS